MFESLLKIDGRLSMLHRALAIWTWSSSFQSPILSLIESSHVLRIALDPEYPRLVLDRFESTSPNAPLLRVNRAGLVPSIRFMSSDKEKRPRRLRNSTFYITRLDLF
jgi:hypothetical protein